MAHGAPIIGFMDRLGYLTCMPCSIARDKQNGAIVRGDNSGFFGEKCDACGKVFQPKMREDKTIA